VIAAVGRAPGRSGGRRAEARLPDSERFMRFVELDASTEGKDPGCCAGCAKRPAATGDHTTAIGRVGRMLDAADIRRAAMCTRARDISVATVGLALGSPLAAAAAIAIKLDSPGPVLYRRRCCGRHGRPFTLLRLRTMPHPPPATRERTRIGRVLVRFSIDEWPLLWNVMRGDMSLVGPRAEGLGCIDPMTPEWAELLQARPGVTSHALATLGGNFNRTAIGQRRALELEHARSTTPRQGPAGAG
jgi:lipopolysaccharide/colanic/teichoic acid biosynthesis glycosyltransferase